MGIWGAQGRVDGYQRCGVQGTLYYVGQILHDLWIAVTTLSQAGNAPPCALCLKARDKLFVFLPRCDIEPTNNASERAFRMSVIFRKVTNGFLSIWGAKVRVTKLQTVFVSPRDSSGLRLREGIDVKFSRVRPHYASALTFAISGGCAIARRMFL